MGLVNTVVPLEALEEESAGCREMLELSPALRLLKASFNAAEDGPAGLALAHDANLLFYASEEAQEAATHTERRRTSGGSRGP